MPKVALAFAEQNVNLKTGIIFVGLLCTTALLSLLVLIKRGPVVIALKESGEVASLESKMTEPLAQAAVREYVRYRYQWSDHDVGTQLKQAESFVSPSLIPSFQKAMVEVQRFAREKKVSQRVYPREIQIDFKNMTAIIRADRITEFETLKAATSLNLTLQLATDARTPTNPWGIYIRKETEAAQ